MIAAPISSVYPNMGSQVLIMCFVVVVIGGIGSVRGALISALLVGLVDTFGKVLLPQVAGHAGLHADGRRAAVEARRPVQAMSAPKPISKRCRAACRSCWRSALVALVAFPFVGTDFYAQMVARMMILAIFAMSLDLLLGVTGLVSLGHAAFFGLAGYALAFLTPAGEPVSLWWTLPAAVAASGLAALVIGFFVVRTHGIYFIMVTMAFAQMVFFLFFDNKALGGSDGIYVNFKPDAELFDLENKRVFYYFTLAVLLLVYAFLRRLLWSPFGRVLAGIRVNEHRMRAMGYGTFGYKLAAFTLAGALAGLAGYLWARADRLRQPRADGLSHERARDHDGHPGRHGQLRRRHRRRLRLRIPAALCSRTCPPSAASTWASTGSCGWACSSCWWWCSRRAACWAWSSACRGARRSADE